MQQGLQESLPLIRKGVGQEISSIGLGDSPQRTAGWKRSLSIAGIRNSLAISAPFPIQKGSFRSNFTGAMASLTFSAPVIAS